MQVRQGFYCPLHMLSVACEAWEEDSQHHFTICYCAQLALMMAPWKLREDGHGVQNCRSLQRQLRLCIDVDLQTSVLVAGLDSADLISQLRASHAHDAKSKLGVDVLTGGAGDMDKLGIFESFKVRRSTWYFEHVHWAAGMYILMDLRRSLHLRQ